MSDVLSAGAVRSRGIIVGAALAAALALGAAAGLEGLSALAVLIVVAAGVAMLYRPFFGLLILVATFPVENLLILQEGFTFGRLLGMAVFGAWFVGKLVRRESWRPIVSTAFFPLVVVFAAFILTSTLWARSPWIVRQGFMSIAQMAMLALIVIDLADSRRRLDLLAKVLVTSAAIAAALTVYQFEVLGMRRAGEDIAGGINSTAVLLVTVVPFGFYLLRAGTHFGWRLLGLAFIPLAALAVSVTLSRFNLLLLPPLLLVLYLLALKERRSRRWLAALTAVGAVGLFFHAPWENLQERMETVNPYLEETLQLGSEQGEVSGRGYHLLVGLAIMRDHPLLGVGYGNYGTYLRDEYQFQVPGSKKLFMSPRSPHSTYIGIGADLGAAGLLVWLVLLAVCLRYAWRAWWHAHRSRQGKLRAYVEAVGVGLLLHVVAYGWYTPSQQEKVFWLILALAIAVGNLSRAGGAEAKTQRHGTGADRRERPSLSPSSSL